MREINDHERHIQVFVTKIQRVLRQVSGVK